MKTLLLRPAVLITLCAAFAASGSAQVEGWHSLEAEVVSSPRLNLVIQGQFRTRDNYDDYYQTRIGPIMKFRVIPRLTLVGGYYIRDSKSLKNVWTVSHRPFGGVEGLLVNHRIRLSGRVLCERFINDVVPDYWRFRESIRVATGRRISPYGLVEAFQTPKGAAIFRKQGGVQFVLHPRASVDVGFLHDASHHWYGPDRKAVLMTLKIRVAHER